MNRKKHHDDLLPDHLPETSDWSRRIGHWLTAPFRLLVWPLKFIELLHDHGVDEEKEESWFRRVSRALRSPFQLTDLFHHHGVDSDRDRRTWLGTLGRIVAFPLVILLLPLTLLIFPFQRGKPRYLWGMLPLIGLLALSLWVSYGVFWKSTTVQSRYYIGAQNAVRRGNLNLAKRYFTHLMQRRELNELQSLQWSYVLANTGAKDESHAILDRLAPHDEAGFPEAHASQAVRFANQLLKEERNFVRNNSALLNDAPDRFQPNAELMAQLGHHLQHANTQTQDLAIPKAIFLVHSKQPESAFKLLESLVDTSPEQYLAIAAMGQTRGLKAFCEEPLRKARAKLQAKTNGDKLDRESRYLLVRTLIWLDEYPAANSLIVECLNRRQEERFRKAISISCLAEYDQLPPKEELFSYLERIVLLNRAIQSDPMEIGAFVRLARLLIQSTSTQSASGKEPLNKALGRLVSSDRYTAVDHVSLAFVRWKLGNRTSADRLLEQAWGLDNNFSDIGQRLALSFALQGDQSGWSEHLAKKAVEESPKLASARVTMARIYRSQQNYKAAIEQLLVALDNNVNKPEELHMSVSYMYQQLGDFENAQKHEAKAMKIKTQKTEVELIEE